jgi:hypothetical protein
MVAFLDRIENADPNSPDISDDDKNAAWGHYQFTASSLTCRSVLLSWSSVGSVDFACQLIAAAIKTSRVARQICHLNQLKPTSFLSDIYLSNIIELLWGLCKDMNNGVSQYKYGSVSAADTITDVLLQSSTAANRPLTEPTASSSAAPNNPTGIPALTLGQTPDSSEDHPAGPDTTGSHSSSAILPTGSQSNICTREMLQVLTKEELRELIKARKLIVAGIERCPKNGKYIVIQNTLGAPLINLLLDLLSAILEAPQDQHPSQQDIDETLRSVSYSMNAHMCTCHSIIN